MAASGWQVPTTDEKELFLRFLAGERQKVLASAEGLDEDQARWTPDGHLLPIIGIIRHLTEVEWRWTNGRYLQEPVDPSGGRPGQVPPGDEEFAVKRERTLDDIVTAYRARGERTAEIVRSAPNLDAPCPGSANQPPRPGLYLRWVLLHLIEETAHHAGHADATRELLDGTRHA
jgi:uncharacterized damage-inducible protein DinB